MAEIFPGYSEFGRVLADYITREAAARGAVLSDNEGDTVDLAFDEARTSALEVQILGAQLDRAAERLSSWFQDRGRGQCEILIEASHGRLCCAFVGGAYVLAVLSEPAAGDDEARATEAERVLAGFRELRRDIEALLDT
ncbi:hypothetical protein [Nannocystis pusilla]|uniref:Roadblock/LAMTOR2 domain-containing protein n=1 Tax=Nannocystis pusilla TaxID=889268 RepID=A0ABS7U1M7_9BACT|nr:hypothetical protein [Nannocystis pusilla]MBZ5714326.1 hypothetical protein [Nannocystis pusilla]